MASNNKNNKGKKNQPKEPVVKNTRPDECPLKQGDNCLVPGGFNDSEPIGGG